jgi:hypothetical protein
MCSMRKRGPRVTMCIGADEQSVHALAQWAQQVGWMVQGDAVRTPFLSLSLSISPSPSLPLSLSASLSAFTSAIYILI